MDGIGTRGLAGKNPFVLVFSAGFFRQFLAVQKVASEFKVSRNLSGYRRPIGSGLSIAISKIDWGTFTLSLSPSP